MKCDVCDSDGRLNDLNGLMVCDRCFTDVMELVLDTGNRCQICGAAEGEYHEDNCEAEICPLCGLQVVLCDCNFFVDHNKIWRHPYIHYPNVCARCGKPNPEIFTVPNKDWKRYVQRDYWDRIICRECYNEIKSFYTLEKDD